MSTPRPRHPSQKKMPIARATPAPCPRHARATVLFPQEFREAPRWKHRTTIFPTRCRSIQHAGDTVIRIQEATSPWGVREVQSWRRRRPGLQAPGVCWIYEVASSAVTASAALRCAPDT
eukprot:gene19359-biopygen10025